MRDPRALLLLAIIIVSSVSIGALAGYRLILHAGYDENAPPITAQVIIHWPTSTAHVPQHVNVTLQGFNATAYGATLAATEALGLEFVSRHYHGMGEYIIRIGDHEADRRCGWLYAAGPADALHEGEQAADKTRLDDGDVVSWRWGCV